MSTAAPVQIEVLVDFDNVAPDIVRTELDADGALAALSADLGPRLKWLFPSLLDATVRLYGAWRWADNTIMRVRSFLASACSAAATSAHGYAMVFELADAWSAPRVPVSSYMQEAQCRCRYHVLVREQKLVDTMLVCDLIYLATFPALGVVVVTDDHDVVPGFGQAAHIRQSFGLPSGSPDLVWLRPSSLAGRADRMISAVATVLDYARTVGGETDGA